MKSVAKKRAAKKKGPAKYAVKKTGTAIGRLEGISPQLYTVKPASGTRIDRYIVTYWTDTPSITLIGKRDIIATVRFYDSQTLPKNANTLLYDQAWMYFHRDDFANVLDLLRNEDPLYLVHRGGPGTYRIAISSDDDDGVLYLDDMEPVGEGER